MAKNLDHSTPSNKSTSKRQSFENSVERFLERHHLAGNPATDDDQIIDEVGDVTEEGAATEGSMIEVEIVDPIEKTMEAPPLVVDENEGADMQDSASDQDVIADPIESTVESPFLVIPDEEEVYDGDALVDEDPAADGYDDEYYDDGYYDDGGYYYDDYEQPAERRGVRRGVVAALVAGVAVASFVAGGLAVRFFLQTPAAPIEAPAPVEMQASLTEKTNEDTDKLVTDTSDQNKSKSDSATTDDTKSNSTTNTNSDTKKNTKKNSDTSTKSDAPSYDTGDDTTDDSDSSSSKKKTTAQDNEWRWDLDDNGGNSISYNKDNQEMTVDYDGYKLTVPMGDLVDQTERTYGNTNKTYDYTDRTYQNYDTRDDSGYRGYDYGRDGSGNERTRSITERDYSRRYGTWS